MSSTVSESEYATRSKAVLALVQQLRAIGAQSDLNLPRICVIGNQSAGKSSVVEAISGIHVPRDAGTCTRCPMECRLSSGSEWSCRVSIRYEFDESGKRLDKVSEEPFGDVITKKADVELALRRAQAAILNPSFPTDTFLNRSVGEIRKGFSHEQTLPFSRNVVCVDLEGPDLTDLSFIDLPGIIQNAEPKIVLLVEDMVVSYIKGNCLILVALPMTDDIENQKALRLAQQEDPEGVRTIGVVTKPDLLGAGSTKARALWKDIMEGRCHILTHGYYCTRQPDDDERSRNISPAEARAAETTFFNNTKPWSDSPERHRYGTAGLVATLSKLLVHIINQSIPSFRSETTAILDECRADLTRLPQAIQGDPATYVLSRVTDFCQEYRQFVQGGPDAGRLHQECRVAYSTFKLAIRGTAPRFVPWTGKSTIPTTSFGIDDDGEPEEITNDGYQSMDVIEMRHHIEKSITRELPDNVPFQSKVELITAFQRTWPASATICFDKVQEIALRILMNCVSKHFNRHNSLETHIQLYVSELVKKHYQSCLALIHTFLECEQSPYTQNTHYLESCKEKWLALYKERRTCHLQSQKAAKGENTVSSGAVLATDAKQLTTSPHNGSGMPDFFPKAKEVPLASAFGGPSPNPALFNTSSANSQKPPVNGFFGAPTAEQAVTPRPKASDPSPLPFNFGGKSNAPSGFLQPTATIDFGKPASTPVSGQPTSSLQSSGQSATQGSSQSNSTTAPSHPAFNPPLFGQPSTKSKAAAALGSASNPIVFEEASKSEIAAAPSRADPDTIRELLAALAKAGYTGVTEEDLGKLNPPDEFESELRVMAEVRGYFQVTYKRVIDNIPSAIHLRFIQGIMDDMQAFLIGKLGLGSASAAARCAAYVAEDVGLVAKREELEARKRRLELVESELYNFGL